MDLGFCKEIHGNEMTDLASKCAMDREDVYIKITVGKNVIESYININNKKK